MTIGERKSRMGMMRLFDWVGDVGTREVEGLDACEWM